MKSGDTLTDFAERIRTAASRINSLDASDPVPDIKEKHMIYVLLSGALRFSKETYGTKVDMLDDQKEINFQNTLDKLLTAELRSRSNDDDDKESSYEGANASKHITSVIPNPSELTCRNWKNGKCSFAFKASLVMF